MKHLSFKQVSIFAFSKGLVVDEISSGIFIKCDWPTIENLTMIFSENFSVREKELKWAFA
jgi:hypothetical protein